MRQLFLSLPKKIDSPFYFYFPQLNDARVSVLILYLFRTINSMEEIHEIVTNSLNQFILL